MSDPKRAPLITVGAPKSAKRNVTKTVRLTINLDESNESKYPELNCEELVIAAEEKQRLENGKTAGLDPFSDNDDDVERIARKFEQKYGTTKTRYNESKRKSKASKRDVFADIGAGYDENDSFIDNTDGYDEMIPPECDTLYGGFYINCGSLEFKAVPDNELSHSDADLPSSKRNKRRISSSSSEDDSSKSSSGTESGNEKGHKASMVNGNLDSHKLKHRKKKNKKSSKSDAKRIRRTDSSAATSGKHTSDDNGHGEAESADSRTSQSDSLASKPAPSSENAITSDSSRDAADAKSEMKLPSNITCIMDELAACVTKLKQSSPSVTAREFETVTDPYVLRLDRALSASGIDGQTQRCSWSKAAHALDTSRAKLLHRARALTTPTLNNNTAQASLPAASTNASSQQTTEKARTKRKEEEVDDFDVSQLTPEQKEEKISEALNRLKALIEERKPSMMQTYQAECERVQEERKKLMIASAVDGAPHIEKRLPKRRFPWCGRTRVLLMRMSRLAGGDAEAARLLVKRVLPLFPTGFVRVPTLLRQANLNRDLGAHVKQSELKRQPLTVVAPVAPVTTPVPTSLPFSEPIHFPSSLTVTTTTKPTHDHSSADNNDKSQHTKTTKSTETNTAKPESQYPPTLFNTFNLNKDIVVECMNDREDKARSNKDTVIIEKTDKSKPETDKYMNLNNMGSVTITAVTTSQKPDSRPTNKPAVTVTVDSKQKDSIIRVKSHAMLNKEADELAKREKDKEKQKIKQTDKSQHKPQEKSSSLPVNVDFSYAKDHKKPDSQKPLHVDASHSKDPKKHDSHKPQQVDPNYSKEHKRPENPKTTHGDASYKEQKKTDVHKPLHVDTSFPKDHKKADAQKPLQIDTSYPKEHKKLESQKPSPIIGKPDKIEEVTQKQIEALRVSENHIPKPALIPVHHSPTFAKPDKRPPDINKKLKKDVLIISDLDPLSDNLVEPLAIDDSSSDVEVIEDMATKTEPKPNEPKVSGVKICSDVKKPSDSRHNESVPSNREKTVNISNKKSDVVHNSYQQKHSSKEKTKPQVHSSQDNKAQDSQRRTNTVERMEVDDTEAHIHQVMQNLREIQDSQEHNFNSNSYGGVITSEQASLNKMDGCSVVNG